MWMKKKERAEMALSKDKWLSHIWMQNRPGCVTSQDECQLARNDTQKKITAYRQLIDPLKKKEDLQTGPTFIMALINYKMVAAKIANAKSSLYRPRKCVVEAEKKNQQNLLIRSFDNIPK